MEEEKNRIPITDVNKNTADFCVHVHRMHNREKQVDHGTLPKWHICDFGQY